MGDKILIVFETLFFWIVGYSYILDAFRTNNSNGLKAFLIMGGIICVGAGCMSIRNYVMMREHKKAQEELDKLKERIKKLEDERN